MDECGSKESPASARCSPLSRKGASLPAGRFSCGAPFFKALKKKNI